ncbi:MULTISPECIES: hypothetical protein [Gemmobacter]|jgi:integral membrane sensor domain MASE1|uniref:Uncharacterized protein n=2 Tax=Gemmobacter TaxID=204456 RepID=A0A2T6ARD0_9RHOB|nr:MULTISPECIES: hypothetical protein [Gemmobacter]OJY29018.1 MAG: hypothetical protein BGP11_17430 [Rhodobacterales bacterium 65-51]PTX46389.1 hypothetical protein C8N34_11777 [Gemmobacter caeni]TWI95221.1 hypothetical protein IQ03_03820 [Gemmobacter caeni]GHC10533.1 hypothetical protein GCM10007291_03810 [Gemmobacter nanjingensis]
MRPRGPVFLARRSYRLRRMRDAARLLPVAGAFLFLLPILWAPAETEARDTAVDGAYLFVVWFGLIVVAALMARGLGAQEEEPGTEGGEGRG